MKPDISVIVPVYNVELFLDQGIQSLVEQTHRNIEIILVDDGSSDSSGKICDRWAGWDSRIVCIHQKNAGQSVARNKGLSIAKGKWTAFVDSDDFCASDMLEILLEEEKTVSNADIIIGSYYSVKDNKIMREHFFSENYTIDQSGTQNINKAAYSVKDLMKMAIGINVSGNTGKTNIGVPWGKLYRTDFLRRNRIIFDVGLRRMQDTIFNLAAFSYAEKIRYIDVPIYYYRIWEGSIVNRYSEWFDLTAENIIKSIESQILKWEDSDDAEEVISYKKIVLLLEVIKLHYSHKDCVLSFREKINGIRKNAESSVYSEAIKNDSTQYLNRNLRIFKYLLSRRLYVLVYVMVWLKYHF